MKEKSYLIKDRWEIYQDGVIYDTKCAKDIPQWIFELRDFILENYEKMKDQIWIDEPVYNSLDKKIRYVSI